MSTPNKSGAQTARTVTISNEFALRSCMDLREYASDGDFEEALNARLKTVEAPNAHIALQLLAADECPEEEAAK